VYGFFHLFFIVLYCVLQGEDDCSNASRLSDLATLIRVTSPAIVDAQQRASDSHRTPTGTTVDGFSPQFNQGTHVLRQSNDTNSASHHGPEAMSMAVKQGNLLKDGLSRRASPSSLPAPDDTSAVAMRNGRGIVQELKENRDINGGTVILPSVERITVVPSKSRSGGFVLDKSFVSFQTVLKINY
jgi:hypothetical protein